MFRQAFGNLSRSPFYRETHPYREGLNTKDRAEHLTEVSAQLFEDMTVTYHQLGIAGQIAGLSSNTLWAFRQLQR